MNIKNYLLTGTVVYLLLNCAGCFSLGGYFIGSGIDSRRAVIETGELERVYKIEQYTRVTVALRNGLTPAGELTGTFRGLQLASGPEYLLRYNSFFNAPVSRKLFPAMGDTVILSTGSVPDNINDKTLPVVLFSGFDLNTLQFESPPDSNLHSAGLEKLESMTGPRGRKIDLPEIKRYLQAGLVPLRSELTISSRDQSYPIPLERVASVSTPAGHTYRLVFGSIGLTLDACLILMALRNLEFELFSNLDWNMH